MSAETDSPKDELSQESPSTRLMDRLDEVRDTARDQLRAAWDLHISRIEEQLQKDWREQIAMLLEERFAELADEIGQEVEQRVSERLVNAREAAVAAVRSATARAVGEGLNHAVRRLRFAEGEEGLLLELVDTAAVYCDRLALFRVRDTNLVFLRCHGFPGDRKLILESGFELPLKSAPAFLTAAETKDQVTAAHTSGELSESVAAGLPQAREGHVVLFPIIKKSRVAAVLYVEPSAGWPTLDPVELLATVAAAVLDGTDESAAGKAEDLVVIAGAESATKKPSSPAWDSLSGEEQELHLRAQRFARVQVAELRLHKSNEVKIGRRERNLYGRLKTEIDQSREVFRLDYMRSSAPMVDYLHLELVRTLTNDDESLLGPEYPGPLK